jgi:RNA polymerase sigma-54 factor
MILKDIADEIGMDISTVSRVTNGKYVQTEHGVFELKYFFSEGLKRDDGEDISNRRIKQRIKEIIDAEEPRKPLNDQTIANILKGEGFNVARRTVAKYREQMMLPVSRLRRKI